MRRQTDVEMRSMEICVKGMKMIAFRKETPEEKAARDRADKKKLLDTLWLAAAATLAATEGAKAGEKVHLTPTLNNVKVMSSSQPEENTQKPKAKKVQLSKQVKTALSESRLARMWAKQVSQKIPQIETNSMGLKRKMFNPEGSLSKSGRGRGTKTCITC